MPLDKRSGVMEGILRRPVLPRPACMPAIHKLAPNVASRSPTSLLINVHKTFFRVDQLHLIKTLNLLTVKCGAY